jgi:hypothetical protein
MLFGLMSPIREVHIHSPRSPTLNVTQGPVIMMKGCESEKSIVSGGALPFLTLFHASTIFSPCKFDS